MLGIPLPSGRAACSGPSAEVGNDPSATSELQRLNFFWREREENGTAGCGYFPIILAVRSSSGERKSRELVKLQPSRVQVLV